MANILVIDDEELIRRYIRSLLEDSGHRLVFARNGQEAGRFARSHRFDVIIVDMIMPEKEGIETILDFRRAMPEAKIIAISGGGRTQNLDFLQIARQVGATEVLRKPFVQKQMLDAVGRCLGLGPVPAPAQPAAPARALKVS